MGIAIALALFGVLLGAAVRNRAAAIGGAFIVGVAVWYLTPKLQVMMANSVTGRHWSTALSDWGAGSVSLQICLAVTVLGVLVAWVLFRSHEHRPDWEWDPDHPKARERRRRRRYAAT